MTNAMKRRRYYLASPARAKELKEACARLVKTITHLQKIYEVQFVFSEDSSDSIEVRDPNTVLPDGYEYVASIYLDEGVPSFEIEELIPEDRPK